MIVIDTNVVSEAMKPAPDDAVIAWFNSQAWDSLFLCTPVLAELHQGVEQLAAGQEQMARDIAKLQTAGQDIRRRISALPPAVATMARKPVPRAQPAPQSSAAPLPPAPPEPP